MKNRDGLENNDNWKTPDSIYKPLNDVFNFDYDPCPLNYKVDGLDYNIPWGKSNFINPPYNRFDKPRFIARAFDEWNIGKTCILLIPAATGTKQFHDLLLPYASCQRWLNFLRCPDGYKTFERNKIIFFVEGRVAFEGINTKGDFTSTGKGKHDSMIVILKH